MTTGKQQSSTVAEEIEVDAFGNDAFRRPAYTDPTYQPFANPTVAFLDHAGYGSDEFAYAVASRLCGNYFARRLYATRLKADGQPDSDRKTLSEALNALVRDIRTFNVSKLTVETQAGGPAFADSVRRLIAEQNLPCQVELQPARGQKEVRIADALTPLLGTHRVILDDAVAQDKTLQYQITRLTKKPGALEHDDRLEVLAGAVALASKDDTAVPQNVHHVNRLEEENDQLLAKLGRGNPKPRWGDHRRNY
jgi:hypothetical protein